MPPVEVMWMRLLCVSMCITLAKDVDALEKGLGVKD